MISAPIRPTQPRAKRVYQALARGKCFAGRIVFGPVGRPRWARLQAEQPWNATMQVAWSEPAFESFSTDPDTERLRTFATVEDLRQALLAFAREGGTLWP